MMTMNKPVQKAISLILAYMLALPILSGITAFADDEDGLVPDQTQALTVVGKRVTGDDTYFEISLEVNEDHDNFSSVGVVLQYDPDYIIPAASWDNDALPADMTDNTTWATRRALPTLGLESWSTHTALAYETTDENDKKVGYLYLGAEHPLAGEKAPEASDTPSEDESGSEAVLADEGDTPANPEETEEPIPTPQPGANPVVVARFMYKTTEADETAGIQEVKGKDMKEKLVTEWRTGKNSTGVTPAENWDYDWSANKILTIASDEISAKSPAQYPFAIYTHAYEEKAYMHTFPAPWTPAPSPAASPATAATPKPASAYKPVVGAGIAEANKLKASDITVVTLEGDSAKAGGLKLSDIYSIIFFDWDNSFLGALTAGVGQDPTESIDAYVQAKFVHPTLRGTNIGGDVDYLQLVADETWLNREWSYRGEYPYNGPREDGVPKKFPGSDDRSLIYPDYDPDIVLEEWETGVLLPDRGSLYPVTNKLDYVLAGKDIDPEHPYAYGWTQVITEDVDWWQKQADEPDNELLFGERPDFMPKTPKKTWGILEDWEYYGIPEFDSDGYYDWDTMPDYIQTPAMDYKNITKETLKYTDGNLFLKAVYRPSTLLNIDPELGLDENYAIIGPEKLDMIGDVDPTLYTMSIEFQYRRVNNNGCGVTRAREPAINFGVTQYGAMGSTPLRLDITNEDVIDVQLTPTNMVDYVNYQLRDTYELNVVSGGTRSLPSADDELGDFFILGPYGKAFRYAANIVLKEAFEYAAASSSGSGTWIDYLNMQLMRLSRTSGGSDYTSNNHAKKAQEPLIEMAKEAMAQGYDYQDITWFQMQYAVLQTESPYFNEDAEGFFWENEDEYFGVLEKAGIYGYYP